MAGPSITVLADDLTGAAEIAAIGKHHDLDARIFSNAAVQRPAISGVSVHDTDSRLLSPHDAAERITALVRVLPASAGLVYKKTDSVLRGNVVSECVAMAEALGLARILLVPANPSLGRTISQGQYLVQGKLIHETAFARDPHHPARSASVIDLLGHAPSDWPVSVAKSGTALPSRGIIVGEATSSADVDVWARQVQKGILAAGGAEFFRACLRQIGAQNKPSPTPNIAGTTLVITGSLTPSRHQLIAHGNTAGWPLNPMPAAYAHGTTDDAAFNRWVLPTVHALHSHRLALCISPGSANDDDAQAKRIREGFGKLVQQLHRSGLLDHLVIEGGATAAAISEANEWTSFDVVGEWAPGVIALHPTQAPHLLVTIKPGSYAWPENLWRLLDSCHSSDAKS